jgi:hypothetical protein
MHLTSDTIYEYFNDRTDNDTSYKWIFLVFVLISYLLVIHFIFEVETKLIEEF